MADQSQRFEVVFDGGSKGNPGRGYGTFRLRKSGHPWSLPYPLEFGGNVTNNEAEYRALIEALRALTSIVPDPGGASVLVKSDSRLVVEQMKGAWKVRAANLAPLNMAARRAAARFAKVTFVWHPRKESVRLLGH